MFIAHLPAGYLTAAAARRCSLRSRGLVTACLLGSLLPDADLFYCYFADGGRVHHHLYWPHWPIVWLTLLLASLALWRLSRGRAWAVVASFLAGSALLHVALDCVAGDVPLFAPWSMRFYALAKVEALYSPWWLNFLLHWTILAELALVLAALVIFIRHCFRRSSN